MGFGDVYVHAAPPLPCHVDPENEDVSATVCKLDTCYLEHAYIRRGLQ
jgi:hypothetical protein